MERNDLIDWHITVLANETSLQQQQKMITQISKHSFQISDKNKEVIDRLAKHKACQKKTSLKDTCG